MSDLATKGRRRGVPSAQIARLKTKVDGQVGKGGLAAIDILSVEQAKARPHTLDIEFKRYHMDVIDSLVDKTEIDKKHYVIVAHESRIAHIVFHLKSISSYSHTTSSEPVATIKTESKELEVLR